MNREDEILQKIREIELKNASYTGFRSKKTSYVDMLRLNSLYAQLATLRTRGGA